MKQNVNDVLKFRQGREEGLLEGLERGLVQGLEQGLEQGREKGLEQGAYQNSIEVAKSMLEDNLPLDMIAKHAKLDISVVMELKKEL